MVMNFISNLGSDDPYAIAKYLQSDYRFLRDDFESMEAEGMYRSPFLLELIAMTHLSNLAACVEVPGLEHKCNDHGAEWRRSGRLSCSSGMFIIISFNHADELLISWSMQFH